MTKSQVKFLVLISMVLAFWRLLEIPAVNEAAWNFLTIGLVPGTDVVLSAETVIRGSLALFVAALFLIFRKEFAASIPAGWFSRNKKQAAQKPATPAVVAVLHIRPVLKTGRSPLLRAAGFVAGWLVYIVSVLSAAVEKVLRWSALHAAKTAKLVWRAAVLAALKLWVAAVRVWYFTEPFLREFDQWLNKTVHRSKIASEILDIMEACWKEVRARWQRADIRARNMLEDR